MAVGIVEHQVVIAAAIDFLPVDAPPRGAAAATGYGPAVQAKADWWCQPSCLVNWLRMQCKPPRPRILLFRAILMILLFCPWRRRSITWSQVVSVRSFSI
jgi:hypothetical protein